MTAPLCYNCGRPRATVADFEHAAGWCMCAHCRSVCWSHLDCSTRERLVEIIDEAFGTQPPADSTGELLASLERLLRERGEALREALAERDRLREQVRRSGIDSRLGDALRASGINAVDALSVQVLYATAGQSGSHRIVSAMRAIAAWIGEGGAR